MITIYNFNYIISFEKIPKYLKNYQSICVYLDFRNDKLKFLPNLNNYFIFILNIINLNIKKNNNRNKIPINK